MRGLDPKASYALSQSVRSSKETFENYRALDVNTDQYCRLAGSLNPESSDKAGRDELMGIFNSGYQGKTGLAAIKEYLTAMYDRSINSSLDANKSDSLGGRKDSIRKCFGLNVRDPIVLTNERIGSGVTTGSSQSQFDVPPNPGLSPAYCLFEVGSPDARSPWKGNPLWEANAPPLGNGVYWLWGTSDGYGERPANEAFSFYHNFVNTGSTVTSAIITGAVDNYGYIVLNGTKYPSTNAHSDKGYEGFNNIIQPFTVTIPRGANTLEVRCVNSGGSVTAAQNNGGWKNPGGIWLTITVNNNILVKTGCDGWKCTRFFYPQEVFHVQGKPPTYYTNTLADAPSVCQSLGARVATYAELDEAQKNGGNWCSTGWLSDKTNTAFYPITYDIQGGCGNGRSGVIDFLSQNNKAGVNCFGNKPQKEAPMLQNHPQTVLPFNKNQWSRYSPGTSPPVVTPPLPPVTIYENCWGGSGWSKSLVGPRVFNSGADYPSDVSYIRVPAGVTVVISYNGRSFMIVGPKEFNACGGSGDWYFNDKMSTIDIRATGSSDVNSVATPPPAPDLSIRIISATYGGGQGASTGNATSKLQSIIGTRQTYTYSGGMSSLLGFDPVPYVVKDLRITYKNGETGAVKTFYDAAAIDGNGSDYTSFTLSP